METRIANDAEDLLNWIIHDGAVPRTIQEATFNPDRLDRLSTRLSAAYKGINMLVLREGAADWFWKEKIETLLSEEVGLDIHHIFPQEWCEMQSPKIKPTVYNSIINKTPISYKANRMIGDSPPSVYLHQLQNHKYVQLTDDAMNDLLHSHRIPVQQLRNDDFYGFYEARKKALLHLIEKAELLI